MIFAHDKDGQRVHISNSVIRQDYFCPSCGGVLVQKKGELRRHHFAHSSNCVCSDTWEGQYDMSDWHFDWQSCFPYENQEVLLSMGEIKHRADVLVGRTVIEFQHSSLSETNFNNRNNFYYNLGYKVVWLFDLREQFTNHQIFTDDGVCYKWLHPKNTFNTYDVHSGQVEVFFQVREENLENCIIKVSNISPFGIEAFEAIKSYSKKEFLEYLGVSNNICKLPEREDIYENETYRSFCKKYNILLNRQQDRAVQTVDGATLLLAVPGSGKTTVLVTRIGFMILCRRIDPNSILSITYTKAATHDMKKRFSSMFGEMLGNQVEFRTINGIADIIIKKYVKVFNRIPFKLISDEKIRLSLIRAVLKATQTEYPTEYDVTEAGVAISYIKNMMLSDEEITALNVYTSDISQVYSLYQKTLKENRLMDYDDQLVYALKILKERKDILEFFQFKYHYFCVDEAQDTSKLQHAIIQLLASKSNNIFMVGDEDQSIYGFRAAYPQALMDFKYNYPNPFILYMEQNYRSKEEIINKAAAFIEKNKKHYKKNFCATRGRGGIVKRISLRSREVQYEFLFNIAKSIKNETAFLYRDNECIIPLVDRMLRNNISFSAKGLKGDFFSSSVVLDITAFLKLAINPKDTDSFMQIYYKCGYGFKKKSAQKACEKAKREGISVAKALIKQLGKWPSIREKAEYFEADIQQLVSLTPSKAINAILANGYNMYMKKHNLDYRKLELLKILAQQENNIEKFLIRIEELKNIFSAESVFDKAGVVLSTVHSSKGLEYDDVYLLDVCDGIFPKVDMTQINTSNEEGEKYQEERRLFYVAMTRAKNKLCILTIKNKVASFAEEICPALQKESLKTPVQPSKDFNQIIEEQERMRMEKELIKRQRQEEERKKREEAKKAAEEESYHRRYNEVKDLFVQQDEIIFDSQGNRWIKCTECGEIKPSEEFTSYGGDKKVNSGKCSACYNKYQ